LGSVSPFRARRERLTDDALVVVRGNELSVALIRRDALRAYRRFGEYGVSVLGAPDDDALDALAAGVLVRFEVLTLMTVGIIRAAELEVRPTFRRPHYSVMLPAARPGCGRRPPRQVRECSMAQPALPGAGVTVIPHIDIDIDWNTQDDTGLPWTFADEAYDPDRIVPGAFVVAGRGTAVAVAEVVDRGADGVVHLRALPGPPSAHLHLLSNAHT